jgi:hypothetical protein
MGDEANKAVRPLLPSNPESSGRPLADSSLCFARMQAFLELQARMYDTTAKLKQVGYPRLFSFPLLRTSSARIGSVSPVACAGFDPSPSRLIFRPCSVTSVLF